MQHFFSVIKNFIKHPTNRFSCKKIVNPNSSFKIVYNYSTSEESELKECCILIETSNKVVNSYLALYNIYQLSEYVKYFNCITIRKPIRIKEVLPKHKYKNKNVNFISEDHCKKFIFKLINQRHIPIKSITYTLETELNIKHFI